MILLEHSIIGFAFTFIILVLLYVSIKTISILKYIRKRDKYDIMIFCSFASMPMAINDFTSHFPQFQIKRFSLIKHKLNGTSSYYIQYKHNLYHETIN